MLDKITKVACVRCLIRDMDDKTASKIIEEYKNTVLDAASDKIYENRLLTCKDCKWLYMGTCRKCGMYVEARAYAKKGTCPAKIWDKS